jgi:hypothetical protein
MDGWTVRQDFSIKKRNRRRTWLVSVFNDGDVMEVDDRNFWDRLSRLLIECEIAEENVIPSYQPYNSNVIPTKEAIKEFDTNNRKMANHLAKEDKTKRVNME